jgi:hypothetical protein
VGDEWKLGDIGGKGLSAHDQLKRGSGGGERSFDIAHGNWAGNRGPETAGGDGSDRAAGGGDHCSVARGSAALGADADAAAARTLFQLAKDPLRTDESALGAAVSGP